MPLDQNSFATGSIRELFEDRDGFLWIGTRSGLYRYDGHLLRTFIHQREDPGSIGGNHILDITQAPDGCLWIGTEGNGVSRYNPETGQFKTYTFLFEGATEDINTIWGIWPEKDMIWLGSRDGLIRMGLPEEDTKRYRVIDTPVTPDQRRQNMIRQIRPDPFHPDLIWFSTLSGLYSFDQKNVQISSHQTGDWPVLYPLEDESDGQYMYAGFEQTYGSWLLGAWGGGHYLYHPGLNKWTRYLFEKKNPKLPLSDNVVLQYARLNDSLFLFTGSKIGIINVVSPAIQFLTLPGPQPGPGSYSESLLIDRSGYLWIAYGKSLFRSMQPVREAVRSDTVKLYFSSVYVDELRIPDSLLNGNTPLTILPHQQSVRIEFGSIQPAQETSLQFRYRIGPGRTQWMESGQNRSVHFRNLSPGTQYIEVEAYHPGTKIVWGRLQLPLQVNTYFYKQWWFIPSVVLFLIGVTAPFIWLWVRSTLRGYKVKAEYETALAQSEMKALRAQLNPHFLFNALNSIKHFIISHEPRVATRYLNTFASLMRLALEHSKSSFISLENEIEFTRLFLELEQARLGAKLQVEWIIDASVPSQWIQVPPMLLQPYIENAIWHGIANKSGPGKVTIRMSALQSNLVIDIEDDGIGRKTSANLHQGQKTRKSMGMKLVQDRLHLLQKLYGTSARVEVSDLDPDSGLATGTRVRIILPLTIPPHEIHNECHHH